MDYIGFVEISLHFTPCTVFMVFCDILVACLKDVMIELCPSSVLDARLVDHSHFSSQDHTRYNYVPMRLHSK
jgi:hypothetical protein